MIFGIRFVCFSLLLLSVQAAQAETIERLIAAGELEARAVVETPSPLYQKAPILIAVEVGTPFRFKRGVRVRDFTAPGALVRPVSSFALSESRRRDGDTWAFQTLRFRIYSERAGTLPLPELTVFVSIDTQTYGVVDGELTVQAPPLEVEVPPGVEEVSSWVAASEFELEQSWRGELETYQVGDAVTRVLRFTIKDVPAMAIPESPRVELDGMQVYHAPALVDDKTVGGSLEGVREERVVFTFEAGGTYEIPEYRMYWFNLSSNTVEQIAFPGRTFVVAGAAPSAAVAALEPRSNKAFLLYGVLAVLALAVSYFVLRWILRWPWWQSRRSRFETWRQRRRAGAEFMAAAAQQNSRLCLALLYTRMSGDGGWQLASICGDDQELIAISASLMAHAYGDGPPPQSSDLKKLWSACTTAKDEKGVASGLRLNPGPSH